MSMYMVGVIQHHGVAVDYTLSNWGKFPEFFGIACFSLEGIGLIFPIRGSLKDPTKYKKIFNILSGFFVSVYIFFGVLSHMALGSATKEIIFHNFPKTYRGIFVLQFLFAIGIFTTFPVYIQTTINIVKKIDFFSQFYQGENEYAVSTISRALAIIFFFIISMTGVNILDFMSMAGSVCNSYLTFILPILCYVRYFEKKGKISRSSKIAHYCIMFCGVGLSFWGIYYSIRSVVQGHHEPRMRLTKVESMFD